MLYYCIDIAIVVIMLQQLYCYYVIAIMHNATKADKDFKAIGTFSFVSRPPLPLFFLYLPPPSAPNSMHHSR